MQSETQADAPEAAIPMAYYADGGHQPLLAVVRTLAFLGLFMSGLELLLTPFQLYSWWEFLNSNPAFFPRAYMYGSVAGSVLGLLLTFWGVVAISGLLRRPPRGRRMLIWWAWGKLIHAASVLALSTLFQASGGRWSFMSFQSLLFSAEYLLNSAIFPTIVLVLITRPAVRHIFER